MQKEVSGGCSKLFDDATVAEFLRLESALNVHTFIWNLRNPEPIIQLYYNSNKYWGSACQRRPNAQDPCFLYTGVNKLSHLLPVASQCTCCQNVCEYICDSWTDWRIGDSLNLSSSWLSNEPVGNIQSMTINERNPNHVLHV